MPAGSPPWAGAVGGSGRTRGKAAGADGRKGRLRRDENGLLAGAFLQFELEAVLLHLEDGKVVAFHQVDDGFDVF